MLRVTRGMLTTAVVAFVGLSMIFVGLASAGGHSGSVAVSVQAAELAITVEPTANLGTVEVGSTGDTTGDPADDFNVSNNDTSIPLASLDLEVVSAGFETAEANCPGEGSDWELVLDTPGLDQFALEADTDGVMSEGDEVSLPINNSGVSLPNSGLAPDENVDVDLEIFLGTEITQLGAPCPISLTVTAIPAS